MERKGQRSPLKRKHVSSQLLFFFFEITESTASLSVWAVQWDKKAGRNKLSEMGREQGRILWKGQY